MFRATIIATALRGIRSNCIKKTTYSLRFTWLQTAVEQHGSEMEKILGPFNGYVAVVCVREVSGFDNRFAASYEIWRGVPDTDNPNARPVRQKSVGGLSKSIDEAVDIALQLARLHIAGLPAPGNRLVMSKVGATSNPTEFASSWGAEQQDDFMTYQPTMNCPLQPSVRA